MKFEAQIAGAILKDRTGRILLVQEKIEKAYGLWNIPAGYVEVNETPQQAAIRETLEETGLVIRLTADQPMYQYLHPEKKRLYSAFSGEIISGELHADPQEILDAQWKTKAEIEELNRTGKIREPWVTAAISKSENP